MTYTVREMYYTLQGEGINAGRAAVFLRFAGCNLWSGREQDRARAVCRFCDTEFRGTGGPGGGKFTTPGALADAVAGTWPSAVNYPSNLPDPNSCPTSTHPGPFPGTLTGPVPSALPGPFSGTLPESLPGALPGSLPDILPGPLPGTLPATLPATLPGTLPGSLPPIRENDLHGYAVSGPRLVVCTGGEPLLQLDEPLIQALKERDFEVAVETNGTVIAPTGIDWLCVSPKAGAPLKQRTGDELKLVYPQPGAMPDDFVHLDFKHFLLQPMDGPDIEIGTRAAVDYCLAHPQWRLSLQTHKVLRIA